MELAGARCLVTGAARGIGRETAKSLAAVGAVVWATGRDLERLADFEGGGLMVAELDVTKQDSVDAALRRIGDVDVLVNNAATMVAGAVEEVADDELSRLYETNVVGPWRMVRAVLPGMRLRGSGAIVNLCSIGGELPYPGLGAYRSSKFALRCLSWTLHLEVAHFGIRVINVEPGAVATDFAPEATRADPSVRSVYGRMRLEGEAAYGRIVTQKTSTAQAAEGIVAQLTKSEGPVDVRIGEDAMTLATFCGEGFESYERALRDSFGFSWHPSGARSRTEG
jgi:NAD(P)-dependent dehydrogenase (short-subunit alcohol dehydrogenase family)